MGFSRRQRGRKQVWKAGDMTLAQVQYAEQQMAQQWHDLVMAEQAGQPLETLEQMYDRYILLVEEFNDRMEEYQHQKQNRHRGKTSGSASRPNNITGPVLPHQSKKQDTKLAS